MRRTRGLSALSAMCAFGVVAEAAAIEITPGSTWTIVWQATGVKGVDEGNGTAAKTVAAVLTEAVGARIAVTNCASKGGNICLGAAAAKQAGLSVGGYAGFENSIVVKNGNVYLFGHDRAGANTNTWEGCFVPSAMAAVRFMQKFAGAAFLMPGSVGTEVARRDRIVIPDGYRDREKPRFDFGAGRYPGGIACCYANGIVGYAGYHTYGGHTYPAACPRKTYFKEHPEYFAMKRGKRTWGSSDGCQAYCISNKGFQKLLYDEMLRRYDAGAEVCQLGQHDGWSVCECPDCEAMYGTGKDWGEKFWLFHREIAERLAKDRPGKLVHIMNYAHTAAPPKSFTVFPSNVLIEACNYSEEALNRWKGYTVPHGFTYYLYNWGNYPILGFTAKHSFQSLADQVRRLHRTGLRGVYRCGYGELFGTEGPAYWVFNRLLQNPDLELGSVVDEYCRLAFGPAAAEMKAFYGELDEGLRIVDEATAGHWEAKGPGGEKKDVSKNPVALLALVYTPERRRAMAASLRRAIGVPGLSPKQTKRLELVRTEFEYARLLGEVVTRYTAHLEKPSRATFKPLAAALHSRTDFIDALYSRGGRMRQIEGWPELRLFRNADRKMIMANGRMRAAIDEPITWELPFLEKYDIVPDERMTPAERKAEIAAKGLKPLVGWAPHDGSVPTDGSFFKPYANGLGFAFGSGTNAHMRISRRVGAADGLLPGKTYRVSWITRYRNVQPNKWWRGYFFTAWHDIHRASVFEPTDVPKGKFLKGAAPWTKRTAIVKICDRKNFTSTFSFRFWDTPNALAEVAFVTIEEVE